jgi:hypothetical protein
MSVQRTHVVIPDELVVEIDTLVGKRGRSRFLVEAARKELQRLRQFAALRAAAGAWKREDHPELDKGVDAYVRKVRRESDGRLRRLTPRA